MVVLPGPPFVVATDTITAASPSRPCRANFPSPALHCGGVSVNASVVLWKQFCIKEIRCRSIKVSIAVLSLISIG
jgi:hypothetical protein